ncbi:MAG: 3'-5' exonuclease [Gemmatimonadetes bacterium]|nr:3'-5' exonuclease [Gemmatimonadota bacterium]
MTVVLAFDLETVPDTDAGRRLHGLTGTDAEVAAAMLARRQEETGGRTDFLKPAYHRVVGLGVAGIALGPSPEVSLKSWARNGERDLIRRFLDYLRRRPQLVSWNGSGFDLPVIRYRALLHDLDAGSLYGPAEQRQWESYAYRYSEAHVDLMDVLAGHGASPAQGLDEMARLAGLPGKTAGSGDLIANLVFAGDWGRIERYVGLDAAQTLLLFLRWQAGRGRIGGTTYVDALKALRTRLSHDAAMDGAIEAWLAAADTAVLAERERRTA